MKGSGRRTRSMVQGVLGRSLLAVMLSAAALLAPVAHAGNALATAKIADLRGEQASRDVRHIADWAVHSGDHGGLPFVIVDKLDSRVFVFDAQGRLRGSSAALVGSAPGDHSVPDIGTRKISAILPEERTTPAGRFNAVLGTGPKGEDILWVDYDSALALHRVVTSVPQERRLQRLQSPSPSDRRITYGCINVPVSFYDTVVRPTFAGTRGVVYILPESRRTQELFGSYDVEREVMRSAGTTIRTAH